jgi:hypothetical protein
VLSDILSVASALLSIESYFRRYIYIELISLIYMLLIDSIGDSLPYKFVSELWISFCLNECLGLAPIKSVDGS